MTAPSIDTTAGLRRGAIAVLAAFTLLAGVTQMLWLNFAPLITLVRERYGVSELVASTLVLVFPLLYVLLSIPAGQLVDRKGYRFAVGWGGTITALFATLRIWDESFAVLLAAQIGIAVAQPLVINGISKLVADWFVEAHGAVATGIGTVGMFLGMAVAMAATPALVASSGLTTTMVVFAAIAWVSAGLWWWLGRERTANVASAASGGLGELLRDGELRRVLALAFLGLGFFNGLTTWLEPMLAPSGFDAEAAGLVGGVIILGGIVGSVVVPALSDGVKKRKPFLIGCALAALPMVYPLCTTRSATLAYALGFGIGFALLPAFALLLEMCSELSGKERAGNATGLLMLMGNGGGVVVILAMDFVHGDAPTWMPAVWLLLAVLVVTVVLAFRVRETYGRAHG
jgi:predicted MFS family arabinose efflux permease